MEYCITCNAYYQRETADGMIRKCKIDGTTVHPYDHCNAYEPFVWLTEENYDEWVEKMVAIKGMKMPETCEDCNLESLCSLWVDARKMSGEWKIGVKATARHPECPLVEIYECVPQVSTELT